MKRALYICTLHHRRSKEFNIWSMSLKWNFWQSLTEDLKVIWKLKENLTMKRFGQRGKVTQCDNEVLKILFHLGEQYLLNCYWSVFSPVIVIWIINKVQYRSIFWAVQFTLSEAQNTFFNYRHSNYYKPKCIYWLCTINRWRRCFNFN